MRAHLTESDWRTRVEQATEFLSIMDEDFRLVYVNHPQPGIDEYQGKPILDFVAREHHDLLRETVARTRATRVPQHFESWARGPMGERSFYSNWTIALGGTADGLVAFIATDISHRRRMEAALESSETTVRALVDSVPDYILIIDADRTIQFVNRVPSGLTLEAVIGKAVEQFAVEDQRETLRAAMNHVFETGQPTAFEVAGNFPDGRLEFFARMGPILHDGTVRRIAMIATEITERREAERQQQLLSAQLHQSQKMEAVGQLTGGVAHDFNNLLTVIAGSIESCRYTNTPEAVNAELEIALAAVGRAANLTQRLLAFSRRQTLRPTSVDIVEVMAGMEDLLRRTLGETIEIVVDHQVGVHFCMVDRPQLEAVILNLALNARDAMPRGGRLTMKAARQRIAGSRSDTKDGPGPGEYVVVSVRDSGTGMDERVLRHACEPFFTTKAVGRGSGLGLSVAYGFMRQSGGMLRLESELGAGTTARLFLPRSDRAPEAVQPERFEAHGHGERVLVVEDDDQVRRMLSRAISRLGYEVFATDNPTAALDHIESTPDLSILISDVVLAGDMDGLQLARLARGVNPAIGVLLVSGYPRDALEAFDELDASVELLSKPLLQKPLAEAIRRIIDRGNA